MPSLDDAPVVSSLTFPKSVWRYLLLFQSWSQFQSWALVFLTTIVLINLFFRLTETPDFPMAGLLIGTALGSLCSVVVVLPTEFVIKSCPERIVHSLTSELEVLGYVLLGSQAGTLIYRQRLPRLLRWDEGNVIIGRDGDRLVVTGPLMILKKARHFLMGQALA